MKSGASVLPKPLRKPYRAAVNAFLAACTKVPALRKVRFARWAHVRKKYEKAVADTPIDDKSMLLECFGGRQFTCSPRALYVTMLEDPQYADWSFYWSFRDDTIDSMKDEPLLQRATLVERGSDAYYKALAKSKYWVLNNRVPEYVAPREGQVYVQCWHGTPLKRLGCDVPESFVGGALNSAAELAARFKMDMEKWTYLLSPSDFTSEHLSDAFGLPQERRSQVVLQEGYPRNDFIRRTLDAPDAAERVAGIKDAISTHLVTKALKADAESGALASDAELSDELLASYVKRAGIPHGKKVLLYAPTFRDDQYTPGVGYSLQLPLDLDALQQAVGDEWVVLLRMHYYISSRLDLSKWEGFAFNVSDWPDINELYVVADALCTDYSSVFFDYSNTRRPIYFLWPDLEHYGQALHGFYLDPMTLPGPKCMSNEEFIDAFKRNDQWFDTYGEEYAEFRQQFCPLDDGHAAERVLAKIIG